MQVRLDVIRAKGMLVVLFVQAEQTQSGAKGISQLARQKLGLGQLVGNLGGLL